MVRPLLITATGAILVVGTWLSWRGFLNAPTTHPPQEGSLRVSNDAGSIIVPSGWHVVDEAPTNTLLANFDYEGQVDSGGGFGAPEGGALIALLSGERTSSAAEAAEADHLRFAGSAMTSRRVASHEALEVRANADRWTNRIIYFDRGSQAPTLLSLEFVTGTPNQNEIERAFDDVLASWLPQ